MISLIYLIQLVHLLARILERSRILKLPLCGCLKLANARRNLVLRQVARTFCWVRDGAQGDAVGARAAEVG